MNIYRKQFVAACPANGFQIVYDLEIHATHLVRVEHIITACAMHRLGYHENIADALALALPDTMQILRANHHGVDIETRRGACE